MEVSPHIEPAPEIPEALRDPVLRRRVLVFIGLIATVGVVGTALSPYLLVKHPLLLVALAPEGRHLVLAAGTTDLLPWLLVSIPRRTLSMLAVYAGGALYGESMLAWTEKRFSLAGRFLRLLQRWLKRFGAPVLLLAPGYTMSALAGIAHLRLAAFLLWLTLGQGIWLTATYFFGDALSGVTEIITGFLSEYLLEATVVTVVFVVIQQLAARRRRAAPAADPV